MALKVALRIAKLMEEKAASWDEGGAGDRRGETVGAIMHMKFGDKAIIQIVSKEWHPMTIYIYRIDANFFKNGGVIMSENGTTGAEIPMNIIDRIIIRRAMHKWREWAFFAIPLMPMVEKEQSDKGQLNKETKLPW